MNSVVSRNNLPSTNDGASLINFDDKKVKEQIGFHYLLTEIQLYTLILLEYIPQEVLNKIKDKSITDNIFRIQDNASNMCGFCCIAFIQYIFFRKNFVRLC